MSHILHRLWRKVDEHLKRSCMKDGLSTPPRLLMMMSNRPQLMKIIEDELLLYHNGSQWFWSPKGSLRKTQWEPVSWWEKYGIVAPNLVVIRIWYAKSLTLLFKDHNLRSMSITRILDSYIYSLLFMLYSYCRDALPRGFSLKIAIIIHEREIRVQGLY